MIDNYDSFTYNLVDYFGCMAKCKINVVRNDEVTVADVGKMRPSCIIISPGPKTPKEAGISEDLIRTYGPQVPIFGVCLGHQAIGEVYGSEIIRARHLMHGKTSMVVHRNNDELFKGIPNPFQATRYHSLVINAQRLGEDLEPLAFSIDDGEIMAIRHKKYPVFGVQFHPESVCTPDGMKLMENFLRKYVPFTLKS
jgi:anthranilate synthase/aminodeoxychorismate synthase-like glutamine amidotransferase